MTDSDLDLSYSCLAAALTEVGESRAPLLLSMVCLSLIGRAQSAAEVLPLIKRARLQLAAGPANSPGGGLRDRGT